MDRVSPGKDSSTSSTGPGLAMASSHTGNRPEDVAGQAQTRNAANSENSVPETVPAAQPSGDTGVPEDMATLVLDNPVLGARAARQLDTRSDPHRIPDYGADESSDAAIMLRVAAGDESGFNYLVEKHYRAMIHFLFRMVHNQAVAEELAQEVFLRVYRSRASYEATARFTTWMFRIATHLALNWLRDRRNERSCDPLDDDRRDDAPARQYADASPSVEQSMVYQSRLGEIRCAIAGLPDKQRAAVLMHKYEEMEYSQIASVLGCSESAVKSLLFRAYETLRSRLSHMSRGVR